VKTTLVLLLIAGSLAGCAGPKATTDRAAATPPAAQTTTPPPSAIPPDDDAEETSTRIGVRGIDPDAQKGLVERMKACCGPAK
jgi:hypothetical protein